MYGNNYRPFITPSNMPYNPPSFAVDEFINVNQTFLL